MSVGITMRSRSTMIVAGLLLNLCFFSCKKDDLSKSDFPSTKNGVPIADQAVLDKVYTIKTTTKFSDTSLVARQGYGMVITGNSQTERMVYSNWKVNWLDKGYPILNRGIGGTTWSEKIRYIRELVTVYNPHDIILYDGENEFLRARANDSTVAPKLIASFNTYMDTLRRQNPNAVVYLMSMLTCPVLHERGFSDDIEAVNAAYKLRVQQDAIRYPGKVKFIDIRHLYPTTSLAKYESDRIHIKITAYNELYAYLKTFLNILPKADAGIDASHSLSWCRSINYNPIVYGTTSKDPDGRIAGFQWSKVSGPESFTIASPTANKTRLENLVLGVYVFRVTVTDNKGGQSYDDVQITMRK